MQNNHNKERLCLTVLGLTKCFFDKQCYCEYPHPQLWLLSIPRWSGPVAVYGCSQCLFCNAVLTVLSSFAIIMLRKRELVALHYLCSCCHVTVKCYVSLPRSAVGWSELV